MKTEPKIDDLARILAGLGALGASVSFSVTIIPAGSNGSPLGNGEGQGGEGPSGEERTGGQEEVRATTTFVAGGATLHSDPLRARRLYHVGQRVRVPHMNQDGLVSGIANFLDGDPKYLVRWNDNQLRQREEWFLNDDIEPLD